MKHQSQKLVSLLLLLMLIVGSFPMAFAAPYGEETDFELDYIINNPYASVDWMNFDQYKADFHAHSRNSDGSNLTYEMVEDHYQKGFNILAMTDHNYTTKGWENADEGAMSLERKQEIEAGVGRDGRGMLDFSYSNEQSRTDHINTFLVDWNNAQGATMTDTLYQGRDPRRLLAYQSHGPLHGLSKRSRGQPRPGQYQQIRQPARCLSKLRRHGDRKQDR